MRTIGLLAIMATATWADTVTFTYTGNTLGDCGPPATCHVFGHVTLENGDLTWQWGPGPQWGLLPSQPSGVGIDLVVPWANFGLVTDDDGNVTAWDVVVSDGETAPILLVSHSVNGVSYDMYWDADTGMRETNFGSPGTWTTTIVPDPPVQSFGSFARFAAFSLDTVDGDQFVGDATTVPEPAGWMLLGSVLLIMAAWGMREWAIQWMALFAIDYLEWFIKRCDRQEIVKAIKALRSL